MAASKVLGIDIGGSGIKGALVDIEKGAFASHRLRIPTPTPSTVDNVAQVVAEIVAEFQDDNDAKVLGVTYPGVVQRGVTKSAANFDSSFVGAHAQDVFAQQCGIPVTLVNDADAAGLAEVRYGAAKDHAGLVIMTTLGTGIGTALIYDGVLIPNAELGHLEIDGVDYETKAASRWRDEEHLTWDEYIPRLQRYYETLERLLTPDLIVVGGGISKLADQFLPHLKLSTPIVPAKLRNKAGIIGAAVYAVPAN
ncbi:MAG: ROK family protein [Propionibacteriaceae bacterium]|nr:ROK family protein [Micropruina sp.]